MFKTFLLVVSTATFFIQVNKATPVDDVERMLSSLRGSGAGALSQAVLIHSDLLGNITAAVFEARHIGLQKIYSETEKVNRDTECWQKIVNNLDICIDNATDIAYTMIFNSSRSMVDHTYSSTVGAEKRVVQCSIEDCLTSVLPYLDFVTTRISEYVYQTWLHEQINIAEIIEEIKSCGNKVEEIKC